MIVHTLKQAKAALAAASVCDVYITIRTSPGASHYMGLTFLKALFEEAKKTYPKVTHGVVVDCGFDAALAHRAMVMGFNQISFSGTKTMKNKLSKIGVQLGSRLVSPRTPPNAVDLSNTQRPEHACMLYLQRDLERTKKSDRLEIKD